jgi:cell division septation protein DedD
MASREKKGGDFVLESRHLVGVFFLLVVIFGIVFTLGYLMGRGQFDTGVRAAVAKPPDADSPTAAVAAKSKNSVANEQAAPQQNSSDWDFYHSAEPKTTEDHLQPPKKTVASAQPVSKPASKLGAATSSSVKPEPQSSSVNGQLIPKGAIMLQVAALQTESDALALAQALQQKKFAAFVLTPGADKFYRVQVGPYADAQSAAAARRDLEAKGFKTIVKR